MPCFGTSRILVLPDALRFTVKQNGGSRYCLPNFSMSPLLRGSRIYERVVYSLEALERVWLIQALSGFITCVGRY